MERKRRREKEQHYKTCNQRPIQPQNDYKCCHYGDMDFGAFAVHHILALRDNSLADIPLRGSRFADNPTGSSLSMGQGKIQFLYRLSACAEPYRNGVSSVPQSQLVADIPACRAC